ncbi:hypothetical protein J0H58_05875 [bacterium]|nr:hypothetical protein [bacterium]
MRRIVVDGVEYCWKFPRRPSSFDWDCWGGCAALVQLADHHNLGLFVRFRQHHPDVAAVAGFPVVSVVPSQIANAIQRAVAAGWRADQLGPAFGVDGVVSEAESGAAPDLRGT